MGYFGGRLGGDLLLSLFENFNPVTLTVLMYTTSPSLESACLSQIKKKCNVDKEFVLDVNTEKALKATQYKVNFAPMRGDKWAVIVDGDKLPEKALIANLDVCFDSCVKVIRVSDYRKFKSISSNDAFKRQGLFAVKAYGGRLERRDIESLCRVEGVDLSEDMRNYLARSYGFEVQQVCDLFSLMKSGYSVTSAKDVISAIGVGGATIQTFVLNFAEIKPKDLRAQKRVLKQFVSMLEDLTYNYSYQQLRSYIFDTISGFIDLKTEMMLGHFTDFSHLAPESFDTKRQKRFQRLTRYSYRLERVNTTARSKSGFQYHVDRSGITLQRLCLMRLCFEYTEGMTPRENLLKGVLYFVNSVGTYGEEPESGAEVRETKPVVHKALRKRANKSIKARETTVTCEKHTAMGGKTPVASERTLLDILSNGG